MKLTLFTARRPAGRSFWLVPLAAMVVFTAGVLPSTAAPAASHEAAKSGAAQTAPVVTLPYSFICPHCGLKITIKTASDWNKDCATCACDKTNLGCYHEKK